ncbi:UDP-N-acetylglucosamine 2-epimerase (non-hydrolyzing) [Clostridiaceae bacterium]|nr:UDP-N-acetylglucosamine 2-epimerase (non-hydrolyzing) [Clostridiaceae bacterium]
MKKIMMIFGTRPEAIKMCPIVVELKKHKEVETIVCVSGQHKKMLQQVIEAFSIKVDYDLDIMKESQTLNEIVSIILVKLPSILKKERPDLVLIHGDTSTSFASALTCFQMGIPVGHVEAGLRTYHMDSPFPEEFNRQAISLVSKLHFAPTQQTKENLIRENKKENSIFVTGNTVIDALKYTITRDYKDELLNWTGGKRTIIVTAHRRENWGDPLKNILYAIKELSNTCDVKILYVLHKNPVVREPALAILSECKHVKLIEPMDVIQFHNIMSHAYLIITDSGGIQEEASALHIPVLVVRNVTERQEGVSAGTLRLVGTDKKSIVENVNKLLMNQRDYDAMTNVVNPYGDGFASKKITEICLRFLGICKH